MARCWVGTVLLRRVELVCSLARAALGRRYWLRRLYDCLRLVLQSCCDMRVDACAQLAVTRCRLSGEREVATAWHQRPALLRRGHA